MAENFYLYSALKELKMAFDENLLSETEYKAQKEVLLHLQMTQVCKHTEQLFYEPYLMISSDGSKQQEPSTFILDSENANQLQLLPGEMKFPELQQTIQASTFENQSPYYTPVKCSDELDPSAIMTAEKFQELFDLTPTKKNRVVIYLNTQKKTDVTAYSEPIIVRDTTCYKATTAPLCLDDISLSDTCTKSVSLEDLSVDVYWSLILQEYIPEGNYYPRPSNMIEVSWDPFWIYKDIIKSIVDTNVKNGFKEGASLLFKAYHAPTFGELQIPWCIDKVHFTTSSKYTKAEYCRIDFYCPWKSCSVRKRWFLLKQKLIKKSKNQPKTAINLAKVQAIEKLLYYTSYPNKSYAVVEIICQSVEHTHLKELKGGVRISIHQDLKEMEEIKSYLIEQSKTLRGPLIDLFSKNIQPIVQIAQTLVNQPVEAFLGGFTSIVPYKLACYQKDNSKMRKKLFTDFNFEKNDTLSIKFEKMLKYWVKIDCLKQTQLIDKISFDAKKECCWIYSAI